MMRFIRPRLRKSVGIALAGTAYAAAWLVHGGNGWLWAIVAELSVIAFAISAYVRGGRGDSDEDALAGSRPDERQQLIAQRSWALAGKVAMLAAFIGVTIAVAARAGWWWPFAAIFAVTGFGYLLGLSNYGVAQEDPADDDDDADAGHEVRSPASQ
jgi:hypothetical protein